MNDCRDAWTNLMRTAAYPGPGPLHPSSHPGLSSGSFTGSYHALHHGMIHCCLTVAFAYPPTPDRGEAFGCCTSHTDLKLRNSELQMKALHDIANVCMPSSLGYFVLTSSFVACKQVLWCHKRQTRPVRTS